jgi:SAM-dependent methyltransferase
MSPSPKAVAASYRLYSDLAWLWPLLSPPESYAAEAKALVRYYRRIAHNPPRRPRLLDLGAGGGHVLSHLAQRFECTAVDASRSMLDNCAKLVPGVECVVADLRRVRLKRSFDVVLLHDAADYLLRPADVRAALRTAALHLEQGGVLFLAPTYTRDNFTDGEFACDGASTGDLDVHYSTLVHDPDPSDTRFEMVLVYVIRNRRQGRVQVVEDRHRCGLFARKEWLAALRDAGFNAQWLEDAKAWSLFAATRPR